MYRLIWAIPTWVLMTALYVVLILVGWVVVPLVVLCAAYATTDGKSFHFTWPLMWLWDNYEDGIAAGRQYKDCGALWKQIIYWSCIRNPVNNLRIAKYLSCKIDPKKIGYKGGPHNHPLRFDKKPPSEEWFFAWQGIYTCLWWQFGFRGKIRRLWLGWKLYPEDIYGLSENSYRKHGAGFALQFKVIK